MSMKTSVIGHIKNLLNTKREGLTSLPFFCAAPLAYALGLSADASRRIASKEGMFANFESSPTRLKPHAHREIFKSSTTQYDANTLF